MKSQEYCRRRRILNNMILDIEEQKKQLKKRYANEQTREFFRKIQRNY